MDLLVPELISLISKLHDGAYKGQIHLIVPFIGRKNGTLTARQQSYNDVHRWYRARIEQLLDNMVQVLANTGNTLPRRTSEHPSVGDMKAPLSAGGVCFIQKKIETTTHGQGARGARTSSKIPPRFLHPHPSVQTGYAHRRTYTVSPTVSPTTGHHHPCLVINRVQRVCQILRHSEKVLQNVIRREGTPKSHPLFSCSPSYTLPPCTLFQWRVVKQGWAGAWVCVLPAWVWVEDWVGVWVEVWVGLGFNIGT